jgi:DNA-binding NtrC family response regulator
VDDEQSIREMLIRVLRREHYTVHEAADAEAAIEILETTCIGAILVDRNMPGHDGDWLVKQIHDRFPATAVILATGEYVPPHVGHQPGVAGFLAKPFTVEMVRAAVSDAMVWHQVAARRSSR